jgi:hypothetical protein
MDPRFLRNLAQQARQLLPVARSDFAKAQLRLWIAEFEALAETAECEMRLSNQGRQAKVARGSGKLSPGECFDVLASFTEGHKARIE